MKTVFILLAAAGLVLPLATACTESHEEKTTTHWNGTTSHDETTVTHNPVTGSTTVEKEKSRD